MYLGTFYHTVDDRNRISVPKKFREGLGLQVVITKGLDGCLFIYNLSEWAKIEEKIKQTPLTRSDARSFARHMLSGAMITDIDKLGRILMPLYLKEYAQIKDEIAILGVGERIEVWDKALWQKYNTEIGKNSNEIAERLSETGL